MKLQARLSCGWPDNKLSPLCAATLHSTASQSGDDESYAEALQTALTQGLSVSHASADSPPIISGLDTLFRRRTDGFTPLKQLLGALASLPPPAAYVQPLHCEIDAFAWSFLRGAKNLDLLLPATATDEAMTQAQVRWHHDISALERFERLGAGLPEDGAISSEAYLALRAIVTRPSARDERRVLTSLLLSGPSTPAQISADLGLNYSLGERSLSLFESAPLSAIERRGERFALRLETLALVLFGLRETMGLDLLSSLPVTAATRV